MSGRSSYLIYMACAMLVLAASVASAMSIEAEPVKVTHRNSGPRYDIDEVERTKLTTSANQERAPQQPADDKQQPAGRLAPSDRAPESSASEDEQATPIGHVAIRRIFLFPMMRPGDWSQQDQSPDTNGPREMRGEQDQNNNNNEHEPMPSMFAKPFWPFMTPARPSPAMHHHDGHEERPIRPVHLFGADEASRPPPMGGNERDQDKAESGPEREQTRPGGGMPPVFDPIQMMMDLMHQAISSQLPPNFTTDLINSNSNNKDNKDNKDSNDNKDNNNNNNREVNNNSNDNAPAETTDERPQRPGGELVPRMPALPRGAKNETREDIVEIEGKKYLRKVVTHRHVGDNIMFMTRRLIFVPLNETDSVPTTTDTVATSATDSPTTRPQVSGIESETGATVPVASSSANDRVGSNKPQPTGGETGTTIGEPSTSLPSASSEPTTPVATTTTSEATSPTTTMAPSSEQPAITSSGSGGPNVELTTISGVPFSSEPTSMPATGKAAERLVEENNSNNNKQTPASPATITSGAAKPVAYEGELGVPQVPNQAAGV